MTDFTPNQEKELQNEANKIYEFRRTEKLFTPSEEGKYLRGVSHDFSRDFGVPSKVVANRINQLIDITIAKERERVLNTNPLL